MDWVSREKKKNKNHQRLISPPLFNSFSLPIWQMSHDVPSRPMCRGTQPFNNRLQSDRERITTEGSILWPRLSICFLTSEWVQPDRKQPDRLKGRWYSHLWRKVALGILAVESVNPERLAHCVSAKSSPSLQNKLWSIMSPPVKLNFENFSCEMSCGIILLDFLLMWFRLWSLDNV